jgi:hypothetical protein
LFNKHQNQLKYLKKIVTSLDLIFLFKINSKKSLKTENQPCLNQSIDQKPFVIIQNQNAQNYGSSLNKVELGYLKREHQNLKTRNQLLLKELNEQPDSKIQKILRNNLIIPL